MHGIVVIFVLIFSNVSDAAMSEKQLAAAGKLLRNSCQPKTKVTDEQIESMRKGIWDDAPTLMCYANCVLSSYKLVDKTGKLNEEYAKKQIPTLPKARQAPITVSLDNCKGKDNHDEKCAASYFMLKCVYFDNPENFFIP